MERFLGNYSPYIYAILRIVTGFLFLWHGTQKLFGFPASPPNPCPCPPPPPPMSEAMQTLMTVGGVIELSCGLLILVGLFAGIAAFLASGMMAVAYFMSHFSMQYFLPIQNRGELAVLYCFLFLYIAARGSGILSIDSLMGRKNAATRIDE
jgi:putative oxidoreductase